MLLYLGIWNSFLSKEWEESVAWKDKQDEQKWGHAAKKTKYRITQQLWINRALEFQIVNRKVDDWYSYAILLRVCLHN